jgi:predicted nuclease of predicted toxin-antitoxin system
MTFLLDHDTPDDIAYSLEALGHQAIFLRDVLPKSASDENILDHARKHGWIVITCNRDDFLALAKSRPHKGLIILIRKKTRVAERTALVHLLDRAGESGILNNINFA